MTTDDLMTMTLEELDAAVTARMRADRLAVDGRYLDALDASVSDEGDLDEGALWRTLGGIRDVRQLERIIGQLDREGGRRRAWLAWMERYAGALHERVEAGDDRPMGEDGRPFADELAALLASWPSGPRVRVA